MLRHQVARNGNPDRVEVVENNELASLAGSQGDDFSQVVSGTATVLNEEDGVEPDQVVEVPPSSSHDEDIDYTHQNGIDHTHQNNIDSDHQNDIDHSHQNNSAGSNYRGDNPETQINDVLEVERNEPIVIPARNLFDLDHVEVPVRNPPAIDVDQQIQEALFTAPLWKSVVFSFIILANNVVFLTSFLLLPIKLGRFVLSFIIQTILLIHKFPLASLYTPDVMKFNIQHHDPYLYAVLFRSFKNQNYPLPISEDQTDDSFTEAGVNDFNLLHSYGKIPMTVDRMTNKVLLIVEMSVGYLLLLTVVLVIFSLYIVFRERNTQRMNQSTQNQLPNQSLPFFPQNRQRLIHFYSEVMKWLKVFLFLSIEYTVIPHLIGWILDLVTLSVFSSTIQSRLRFFHQNPLICLIIHFVIGLSFTVHVAIVVSELRKVIQPQYLTKFLPHDIFNFDENTFEMVANSTIKMLFERSLVKLSLALPSILFMVLIPTQFGHYLFPGNIPKYQLNYGEISYEVQLPLELLLFHFFLPALIRKYNHSECVRAYVITVLYWCCHTVGLENYFLDQEVIDEFMIKYFPPQPHVPGRNIQILPIANDLDIRHQINEIEESEQQENIQTENEPIVEAKEESISDPNVSPPSAPPRYLLLKCIWILVFFSGATAIIFTLCLHLPLIIGRAMMATLR